MRFKTMTLRSRMMVALRRLVAKSHIAYAEFLDILDCNMPSEELVELCSISHRLTTELEDRDCSGVSYKNVDDAFVSLQEQYDMWENAMFESARADFEALQLTELDQQ